MSIFANLSNDGLEKTEDRLGGFAVYATDSYDAIIKMAYADKADSGAMCVAFTFAMPGGKEYNETIYITNKQGENFFLNKDDKTKKVPLPGFTTVDDICLCATEKPLSEQPTEERQVKIYDKTEKKEIPKARQVLVDLLNQPVTLGIQNILENKTVKNETTGNYDATAEERNINTIAKVFHTETKLTMVEVREGQDPTFHSKWVEKNKDKVMDRRTYGKNGGKSGTPGKAAPQAGSAPAAPTKSLFGKK